jgi:hypothetical protein
MDVDGVLNPHPDYPAGYGEYAIFPRTRSEVRLSAIPRYDVASDRG